MAARYVNTQNVAAQGQAFYTGLLPGSYEQGGAVGGKNVMGAGAGGSAGVTADRTASDAALKSIKNYAPGGSIFKTETSELASNTAALKANTAGGPPGSGGQPPTPPSGGIPSAGPKPSGGGTTGTQGGGGGGGGSSTGAPSWVAGLVTPQRRQQASQAAGAAVTTAVTARTKSPKLGAMAGGAASSLTNAAVGAVQNRASSRAQTRQPGVQQSATQQSIPFPNIGNSTNRTLNF